MKIRTADLTGAQLDYHTARAQGIPAERLEIRRVPRTDLLICVERPVAGSWRAVNARPYSTDWRLAGALLEQHGIDLTRGATKGWLALLAAAPHLYVLQGPTPQVAICRAVVRATFGEEVEEVAVCE